jgi:hypothetical protein
VEEEEGKSKLYLSKLIIMENKKEFNVVVLSAEKESNVFLKVVGANKPELEYNPIRPSYGIKEFGWTYQNIFIVATGSEINKSGEYVIYNGSVCNVVVAEKEYIYLNRDRKAPRNECMLIVASNELAITPLSWISPIFIQSYVTEFNRGNPYNKVELSVEYICIQTGMNCGMPCNGECKSTIKTNPDGSVIFYTHPKSSADIITAEQKLSWLKDNYERQSKLLNEALTVIKWNYENSYPTEEMFKSDFFNLNTNIITEIEEWQRPVQNK